MRYIFVILYILSTTNSFAEQIPDEDTKCYKKCSKVRMSCRSQCKNKLPANNKKKLYSCLDSCDPPFNDVCVPKCPTKEND